MLRGQCDSDTVARIDAVKQFSKNLGKDSEWELMFKSTGVGPHNWRLHDLKPHNNVPVYLPIVTSTWYPSGKYLRACPLDSLRFALFRPPEAERIEQSQRSTSKTKEATVRKGLIPPESSCAEWDGFLNVMSQLPPNNDKVWY